MFIAQNKVHIYINTECPLSESTEIFQVDERRGPDDVLGGVN